MVTQVIKSIGTAGGRDYSTLQAWEDASPANLITADQQWIGEAYNDSEFTAGLTLSGVTTDATRNIILRAASGHSFRDHASKATNPLYYDQSKGVGLSLSGGSAVCITNNQSNVRITGLQVRATGSGGQAFSGAGDSGNITLEDCILESRTNLTFAGTASIYRNLLIVNNSTAGNGVLFQSGNLKVINCTVVRTANNAASGTALRNNYTGGVLVKNCAMFGFTSAMNGSAHASSSNNATDLATGIGSANQTSLTYANQFVSNNASSSPDFKSKTGAALIDNGVTDTTNLPDADDIIGTARSTWDIGCWEFVSGGGGPGDQSLTPSGFANTSAFGGPTVSPGAVSLLPTGLINTSAFGTPSISPGPVSLLPSGFSDGDSFGSPVLTQGQTLAPTGFADADAFGTPVVSPGAVTLLPSGFVNPKTFGTPLISLNLTPSGFLNPKTFGAPTVANAALVLQPTGVKNLQSFGLPTMSAGDVYLFPSGWANQPLFGTPTVKFPGIVTYAPISPPAAGAYTPIAPSVASPYTEISPVVGSFYTPIAP